jgi:hypothetical protein
LIQRLACSSIGILEPVTSKFQDQSNILEGGSTVEKSEILENDSDSPAQ